MRSLACVPIRPFRERTACTVDAEKGSIPRSCIRRAILRAPQAGCSSRIASTHRSKWSDVRRGLECGRRERSFTGRHVSASYRKNQSGFFSIRPDSSGPDPCIRSDASVGVVVGRRVRPEDDAGGEVGLGRLTLRCVGLSAFCSVVSYSFVMLGPEGDRNAVSKRWLQWLGFTLSEPQAFGYEQRPFRIFEMKA